MKPGLLFEFKEISSKLQTSLGIVEQKVALQGVMAPMPYHTRPFAVGDARTGPMHWRS
jgi:hypothetical protein